jgi:hypothetical protein
MFTKNLKITRESYNEENEEKEEKVDNENVFT